MLKLSRSTLNDILQATSDESIIIMQAGRAASGGSIPRELYPCKARRALRGEYTCTLFDSVGSDTRITLGKSSVTSDLIRRAHSPGVMDLVVSCDSNRLRLTRDGEISPRGSCSADRCLQLGALTSTLTVLHFHGSFYHS
jgi:hypothetical protein